MGRFCQERVKRLQTSLAFSVPQQMYSKNENPAKGTEPKAVDQGSATPPDPITKVWATTTEGAETEASSG